MKIRNKFILIFLTIAIVPLVGFGIIAFFSAKAQLEKQYTIAMQTLTEYKEGAILIYISKLRDRTIDFSSDGYIRNQLEKYLASQENLEIIRRLESHLIRNKLPLDPTIYQINIFDLDAKMVASTHYTRPRFTKTSQKEYVLGREKITVGDIILVNPQATNDARAVSIINVYTPLFTQDEAKRKIGVINLQFIGTSFNQLLSGQLTIDLGALTQVRGMGHTGETYIVNQQNKFVTDSRFIPHAAFKLANFTTPVESCLKENKEIAGVWENYRGDQVVGSAMCISIDNFRWVLITEHSSDETFASIGSFMKFLLLILAITILIIVVLAQRISLHFTRPIQQIIDSFEIIAGGDYLHQLPISSTQDELQKLGQSLNKLTKQLNQQQINKINQDWIRNSVNAFYHCTRGLENVEELCQSIVDLLVSKSKAVMGIFYTLDFFDNTLKFAAGHAYTSSSQIQAAFKIGEGLIGQAMLRQKPFCISDIPADYIRIRSASVTAVPRHLLFIPIHFNDEPRAVIEIASTQPFDPVQIELAVQLSEPISIFLNSVI